MKTHLKLLFAGIAVGTVGLQGCATTQSQDQMQSEQLQAELDAMQKEVTMKDQRIRDLETAAEAAPVAAPMMSGMVDKTLLPPNAKPWECYARLWVPAQYRTTSKEMLVKEESERVEVIPPSYGWVEETVLVKEASSRLEEVPAVYGTEKETIKIKDAELVWRTELGKNTPLASPELLAAAQAGGIDLDAAKPGMCFHEHYRPIKYEMEEQQVLVSEASEDIMVSAPQYTWVEKEILVKEASSKLVEVPAVYEWVEETIIDKPAHTVWKKGTGPIQRIDEATGEIMCLVEVPASYKTVKKRILKSPATTERIDIPAEYEAIKVRELAEGPAESKSEIPAQYKTVELTKKATDASFVWHEIHDREEPRTTRTGLKICLTEKPAQYKTISRKVVVTPATVREVEIPAEYTAVKVRKLVSGPEETRFTIPAEYETVTQTELEKEGFMEWRSILCQTNMTGTRISQIQTVLKEAGYDPGPIDGSIGAQTISAVNAFQRDKGLPVDRYLNIETLDALGVSAR